MNGRISAADALWTIVAADVDGAAEVAVCRGSFRHVMFANFV